MKNVAYPLKFDPILKERIWGGKKLITFLNKKATSDKIGESWEISDVKDNASIISNGKYKGTSLNQLIKKLGPELVGNKNYHLFRDQFPILVKFIDANQDLSIQLHPNDKLSKERHNSLGKTEMWYVMHAEKEANLIVDFNQQMDKEKYLKHLNNKSLPEVLNFDKVKEGDTYFIDVGRIHAIGAGVMLAEIQQTSDITYRVYDWNRVDEEGNARELHNDLALEAIDFNMPEDYKIKYERVENSTNQMIRCPYFTTNYLEITEDLNRFNDHDSFVIYICVGGSASIDTVDHSENIKKGETILMPAAIRNYSIVANSAKLLEVYI